MTLAETLRRGGLARIWLGGRRPTVPHRSGRRGPPLLRGQMAPQLRDWIGVLAMGTGLFLAIMDVQIVTSSLTQIQGGLSASTDEIAWVQTAYLIADVVMVPMCGFMSRLLSTRVLFVVAALGFTGASVLCATATSLGQMIVYRAMQGFLWRRDHADRVAGRLHQIPGPAPGDRHLDHLGDPQPVFDLGPTLGGFLTETFSWHWLFLVNIVPGLAVAAVVWVTIDIDKPDLSLLRHFDLVGHAADGGLSRLPRIRASRRPALGLARRRHDPHRGVRLGRGRRVVFLAGADLPPADRRSAHLPQPQFRARHVFHLHHGRRHVRHDLSACRCFWPRCAATTRCRSA